MTLQELFAAKEKKSEKVYTAEDVVCVDEEGKVVPNGSNEAKHVFLQYGETCPLDLAKRLGLTGSGAHNAHAAESDGPSE